MGTAILALFGILWLAGWISSYRKTNAIQEPTFLLRMKSLLVLFFIWPIVTFAFMRSKH